MPRRLNLFGPIKNLFKSIRSGFDRKNAQPLPDEDSAKKFGTEGEWQTYEDIQKFLPGGEFKRNVLSFENGSVFKETDLVILYEKRLYVVEIKNWRGRLVQKGKSYFKVKKGVLVKVKDPFAQVQRSIAILKKQYHISTWVTPIVLLLGADAKRVKPPRHCHLFTDIPSFVIFVRHNIIPPALNNAEIAAFRHLRSSDTIWADGTQEDSSRISGKILNESIELLWNHTAHAVPVAKLRSLERLGSDFTTDSIIVTYRDGQRQSCYSVGLQKIEIVDAVNNHTSIAINKIRAIRFGD